MYQVALTVAPCRAGAPPPVAVCRGATTARSPVKCKYEKKMHNAGREELVSQIYSNQLIPMADELIIMRRVNSHDTDTTE